MHSQYSEQPIKLRENRCFTRKVSPMAHETIDGTYRQTNLPNESAEYLFRREELRLAEIELRNQRERVAELRRQLPPGAILEDLRARRGAGVYRRR
jgi:hypothetical protein